MNYKQYTKRLRIPVHGFGDPLWPPIELQRFQIIENMLLAGTKGIRNCVFDDGLFSIDPENDTSFVVRLTATGHSPSAAGMVGGAYFEAPAIIVWKGLKKGNSYYLYLRGNSDTFENLDSVNPVLSLYALESDNLLLAVADCSGDQPKIDPYPDGKIYSEDLAYHINDVENPHGRELSQDVLFIRKKLALYSPEGTPASVEVMIDGAPSSFPAASLPGIAAELAGRKVKVIDFKSGGPAGRIVSVEGVSRVLFVDVSRICDGSLAGSLGESAVGHFGDDKALHTANEFSFYNTGDEGLKMRALVYGD
jgi:hypothetical protein